MSTVEGTALILHAPMPGGEVMVGSPRPVLYEAGMPIVRDEQRVGEVRAMWLEEDRVRWIGYLDPPAAGVRSIPVRELIEARRLVGVAAMHADSLGDVDGVQVLDQWTATNVTLLPPEKAPWAELELTMR